MVVFLKSQLKFRVRNNFIDDFENVGIIPKLKIRGIILKFSLESGMLRNYP